MAKQTIALGAAPNDGTGDALRTAFDKANDNFDELYGGAMPGATPASAGAAGVAGTICWDVSYIYVCIATNTWKRAAIASW